MWCFSSMGVKVTTPQQYDASYIKCHVMSSVCVCVIMSMYLEHFMTKTVDHVFSFLITLSVINSENCPVDNSQLLLEMISLRVQRLSSTVKPNYIHRQQHKVS